MADLTRFTWRDGVLLTLLVVLPVVALAARGRAADTRRTVEISRDNRLIGIYPLAQDRVIPVGASFAVEIKSGRVRVLESDCPKGTCKLAGWRSRAGSALVCVPNRVVILIRGVTPDYDAETY